jgi:hypothetical protein
MLSPAHWQAGRALGPYSDRGSAISPKLNCQMHRRCTDRSGSHSAVCPPSRPEEFHPEPLTEPDLILSHHPAHAIARRLPPSIDHWAHPVAGWPMLKGNVTCPFRSSPIAGPPSLLRSSSPLTGASILSASRDLRLRLFPCHRRHGSQVPHKSPDECHASCTPDTACGWSATQPNDYSHQRLSDPWMP